MEDGAWPEDLPLRNDPPDGVGRAGARASGSSVLTGACDQGLPVRADTRADNVYMQRALGKSGFVVQEDLH